MTAHQKTARRVAGIFLAAWLLLALAIADFPPPPGFVILALVLLACALLVYRRVPVYLRWRAEGANGRLFRVARDGLLGGGAIALAVVPMELRAGMVGGHWTPLAARQALWVVSHLAPGEGESLFGELGNMQPSKSSLDRLPKQVSARWEEGRAGFEANLREQIEVPKEAVTVSVSPVTMPDQPHSEDSCPRG